MGLDISEIDVIDNKSNKKNKKVLVLLMGTKFINN
jgi:hypothetical protein